MISSPRMRSDNDVLELKLKSSRKSCNQRDGLSLSAPKKANHHGRRQRMRQRQVIDRRIPYRPHLLSSCAERAQQLALPVSTSQEVVRADVVREGMQAGWRVMREERRDASISRLEHERPGEHMLLRCMEEPLRAKCVEGGRGSLQVERRAKNVSDKRSWFNLESVLHLTKSSVSGPSENALFRAPVPRVSEH